MDMTALHQRPGICEKGDSMSEETKSENLLSEEQKTGRGGRRIGILAAGIVALIAVVAGICFGIYNTPAKKLARQLDLGQKYLAELDYEQAIVAFNGAIEIDPMCAEAYLGKAEAYEGLGDLEAALETLEEGYERTGENADIKEQLVQICLALADSYLDIDAASSAEDKIEACQKAIEILERGYDRTKDERLSQKLAEVQAALEQAQALERIEAVINQLAQSCQQEDYDAVFSLMQSDAYAQFLADITWVEEKYIVDTAYGKIGIYQVASGYYNYGDYMIYYGDYEGDVRQGEGVWIAYYDGNNYYSKGTWESDVPQGYFTCREWNSKLDGKVVYRVISGNVNNGLWDGEVEWKFEEKDEISAYYPSFDNGKWVVIKYNDDGYAVTYEKKDGDCLVAEPEELDYTKGIEGFADNQL
jgi:tetratricopeptide (TPR) repeat protein